MANQLVPYHRPWTEVPLVFVDFETTGIQPGLDRAVEVGLARFENGRCVAEVGSRVNPGIPIPAEATTIHGIADADVASAPTIESFFARAETQAALEHAQPGAYNAPFDKWFCPPWALADWAWPWLDTLVLVAHVDQRVSGKGRHKLGPSCARHGIALEHAHSAQADARAAGELFYKLVPRVFTESTPSIGELLCWTRKAEAGRWGEFHEWLGRQPAKAAS